ncbi:ML domain-containing protein [Mycena galopus ATCC 62051]|nr:ML domain-containing protein [Mycena galopus ATCC 62051]
MVALSLRSILFVSLLGLGFAHGSSRDGGQQFTVSNEDVPKTMAKWEYENCGLPTDVIQLKSLEISPDPPQPGKDLTITVKGEAQERIEEGAYANVVVKLGLVKLLTRTFDLCAEARNANVSVTCPVEKGEYEITHTVALPKEIPPAKFTVSVTAYTAEDADMLCLTLKADFLPSRLSAFRF